MGDCKITKFNGSYNDDSLNRLNALKIDVKGTNSPSKVADGLKVKGVSQLTLDVTDGHFSNEAMSSDRGQDISVNADTLETFTIITTDNSHLFIKDDYGLKMLEDFGTGAKDFSLDLSAFKYRDSLESLVIRQFDLSGSINDIGSKVLSTLRLNRNNGISKVTGNINDFFDNLSASPKVFVVNYQSLITGNINTLDAAKLVSTTTFNIGTCNITGNVEDFLVALLTEGKTSNIGFEMFGTPITFNGNSLLASTYTASFSEGTITVQANSSTVAYYDGTSWTYNN